MGKTIGKDERSGKLTAPALFGVEGARKALAQRTRAAVDVLHTLPGTERFEDLARQLMKREK